MEGLRRTCSRGEGVTPRRHIDGDDPGEENPAKAVRARAVAEWRREDSPKRRL